MDKTSCTMILSVLVCCLVINEVGFAMGGPNGEFVEILNTGIVSIDASQLTLYDERRVHVPISRTPIVVAPGGYLVLVRDGLAFQSLFPGVPHVVVSSWPTLNNGGDRVGVAAGGQELDAVPYRGSWGRPGASIERRDPAGPSWHPVNWGASLHGAGGTPGRKNSRFALDRTPPRLKFADRPHPDTVFALFSEPVARTGASAFRGPGSAGAAIWSSDSTVSLTGLSGTHLEAVGVEDLFGNRAELGRIEVLEPAGPSDLLVSERLVHPRAEPFDGLPDQPVFLELWNPGSRAVSLRGVLILGRAAEDGSRATAHPVFRDNRFEAGTTRVLTSSPAQMSDAFAGLSESSAVSRAVLVDPQLSIVGRSGEPLDEARYERTWHDPRLPVVGTALVRTGTKGLAPTAWASSEPTPGIHEPTAPSEPAAPGSLVITEVLFDAAVDGLEFVEIVALESVELNGTWLQIDRSPAAPDSARIAYIPTPLKRGEIVVGLIPRSGIGLSQLEAYARTLYPEAPSSTRWLPLKGASPLRDTGTALQLVSPTGRTLDDVLLTPHLHHPSLGSADGVSLERRDPDAPSDDATNWSSSWTPRGATPGRFSRVAGPSGTQAGLSVTPRAFSPPAEAVALQYRSPCSGTARFRIFARSGLPVRSLATHMDSFASVFWDGTDESGRVRPPGIHLVRVATSCGQAAKSVVVVAHR